FWFTFIGVNAIFMPMHIMGIMGHPRRYAQATEFQFLAGAQKFHHFITAAAILTAVAQLVFLVNLFWSMFKGKKSNVNPWEATTLKCSIPPPPPHDTWGEKFPVVHNGLYE